jgi:transposase-like protein
LALKWLIKSGHKIKTLNCYSETEIDNINPRRTKPYGKFIREAAELVTEQGHELSKAPRRVCVNAIRFSKWRDRFAEKAAGMCLWGDKHNELKRLRRELDLHKTEERILKNGESVRCKENEVDYMEGR